MKKRIQCCSGGSFGDRKTRSVKNVWEWEKKRSKLPAGRTPCKKVCNTCIRSLQSVRVASCAAGDLFIQSGTQTIRDNSQVQCQKCLQMGHWSYEVRTERVLKKNCVWIIFARLTHYCVPATVQEAESVPEKSLSHADIEKSKTSSNVYGQASRSDR